MIRIGIIGCGRVLPAHLDGIRQTLAAGVCEATITALCSGHIENAKMFRSPTDGIPPREPLVKDPANPMSTPHIYISDFQDHRPQVYDDYRQMLDDQIVDAALVLTQVGQHHTMAADCFSGRSARPGRKTAGDHNYGRSADDRRGRFGGLRVLRGRDGQAL